MTSSVTNSNPEEEKQSSTGEHTAEGNQFNMLDN